MSRSVRCLPLVLPLLLPSPVLAAEWPQFRGPLAGRAVASAKLPLEIGPSQQVAWKVSLPPGHGSPAITAERIFVTAVRDGQLLTIGLARKDGTQLWEAAAPHAKLEKIHTIGSHAQCSPATDGQRVYSFFGSAGMFCYDLEGKPLWQRPMGPFNNDFGHGCSPVLADDLVILTLDHDTDAHVIAFNKFTGETVWKTERPDVARNFGSPAIWEVGGKKQVIVAGTLRVAGYDLATGRELWTVRGISRVVCATPAIGEDNNLYVAGWSAGGENEGPLTLPTFDDSVAEHDANKNGTLESKELPTGPVKQRFSQVDRDKDGGITRAEYEYFHGLCNTSKNVLIAVKPGAAGDATNSHVLWEYGKFVPFCASPLPYADHVFTVKDGGIFSAIDAKTGVAGKQGRLPATGEYYSSPVGGDGKVYLLNNRGKLTVVSAEAQWKVLHTADFGEDTYATPALLDGKIYLRTAGNLYCFE